MFRPRLCPFDSGAMCTTVEMLEWFLPISLPPEKSCLGHQLWFHEFMNLWEVCHNAPAWEGDILWLMARLARCNIGYIDWEPYIPLMFTRFLRSLNLPVSYKNVQSSKHHKLDPSAIALWIVSVVVSQFKPLRSCYHFASASLLSLELLFHSHRPLETSQLPERNYRNRNV